MTIQDVITMVRKKTADEGNTSIWTDDEYLSLANECLRLHNGKHYSFSRRLVNMSSYLQVGETKKYDLPADFHNKNFYLFLDGIQMERIDDHNVQDGRRDNFGYSGTFWVYSDTPNKLEIELVDATGGTLELLYYKKFDTLALAAGMTPATTLPIDDLNLPLQHYLIANFWEKREFFDKSEFYFNKYEEEVKRFNYHYLDKIWKMYREEYRTVMSDRHSGKGMSLGAGRCCSYNSDGILILSNL